MSQPPLNVFSHRADPAGVLALLRQTGTVTVEGSDEAWTSATVKWKSGWFSRYSLTINNSIDYYTGPGWPQQVAGMQNYFHNLQARPDVLRLIASFQFSLAMPDAPTPTDASNPLHQLIRDIAAHLDGVFFLPGYLLDSKALVLAGPEGARDPAAILPAIPEPDDLPQAPPCAPPEALRVARSALVLGAITARALTEREPNPQGMDGVRQGFRSWLSDVGLDDEIEPHERDFLALDSRPDERALTDAVWRSEGLAVLCWALQLTDLPPPDELAKPPELWQLLGVLQDPAQARAVLQGASLRPRSELDAMQVHLLAFHWRMVDYRVRPRTMDFVAFSKKCWFGSFPIDGFDIADNDLALGGAPIHEAGPEAQSQAASTAMERHLAVNWLAGDTAIYSETDVST